MKNLINIILVFLLVGSIGCSSGKKQLAVTTGEIQPDQKIECEAFLFDAKITRAKKLNSFRLELYQTDSLIGLSGRGYLGKGALKGQVRPDSLLVYFPTVNEYVSESSSDIWNRFECTKSDLNLNIFYLISKLPVDAMMFEVFDVKTIENESKKKKYLITKAGCDWELFVTYDLRKKGWRLKKFHINDSDKFELSGNRREYRQKVKIKNSRFTPHIDDSALRVIL